MYEYQAPEANNNIEDEDKKTYAPEQFGEAKADRVEPLIVQERLELDVSEQDGLSMAKRWAFDDKDDLVVRPHSLSYFQELARECLDTGDLGVLESVGVPTIDNSAMIQRYTDTIARLEELLQGKMTDAQQNRIQKQYSHIKDKLDAAMSTHQQIDFQATHQAIVEQLMAQEKQKLELLIHDRRESNRYPWTIPGHETIPADAMEKIVQLNQCLLGDRLESYDANDYASVADQIYIPGQVDDPEGMQRLASRGVKSHGYWKNFRRSELSQVGVAFVNTVGEGEQRVFGRPIPDDTQPDGQLHLERRAYLTREELDKVYRYQQEHGYTVGDYDPRDVVQDMIMLDVQRSLPRHGSVLLEGSERIDKYGPTSSLFVDSPGGELPGTFGGAVTIGGERYRISAVTASLMVDKCDLYPEGLSEMYDPKHVAWDQRYMTAGDYVKYLYIPLPTERDVLQALVTGKPTARERAWCGIDSVTE